MLSQIPTYSTQLSNKLMSQQHVNLGIINPKNAQNMGSILRAAGCYGVDAIFYTGQRFGYAKKFATDTQNSGQRIPLVGCENLQEIKPHNAKVIAVELIEGAQPLPTFKHPDNAFYVFGPEDGSIKNDTLSWCDDAVYIPTNGCMNLAATVNVLLYDRLAKSDPKHWEDHLVRDNRDTNNQAKFIRK